jgi:hypothetical protein
MNDSVTISLASYEAMKDKIRLLEQQLSFTKTLLEQEKQLTWKMFGSIVNQPKRIVDLEQAERKIIKLHCNAPYIMVDAFDFPQKIDIDLITRTLLDAHIRDMLKQIEYITVKSS